METELFFAPSLPFRLLRDLQGNMRWEGSYHGSTVVEALPFDDGTCVILLDYTTGPERTPHNLLRIDGDGEVVWQAEHPASRVDAFVEVEDRDGLLQASTASGFHVTLDRETGRWTKFSRRPPPLDIAHALGLLREVLAERSPSLLPLADRLATPEVTAEQIEDIVNNVILPEFLECLGPDSEPGPRGVLLDDLIGLLMAVAIEKRDGPDGGHAPAR